MPYLGSLLVALAAVLVLIALVLAARAPLRRCGALRAAVADDLGERAAVLDARVAALRARRAEARRTGAGRPHDTRPLDGAPTIGMARSDRGSAP